VGGKEGGGTKAELPLKQKSCMIRGRGMNICRCCLTCYPSTDKRGFPGGCFLLRTRGMSIIGATAISPPPLFSGLQVVYKYNSCARRFNGNTVSEFMEGGKLQTSRSVADIEKCVSETRNASHVKQLNLTGTTHTHTHVLRTLC
jgi:hypothetical protein